MKIAAVSMIKDEADIVELFVRVNSRWADHFFVLDNGSTDATPHILRRLGEEGIPLTIVHDPSIHYRQAEMTTKLAKQAIQSGQFDFIFPIDGDEFIADPAGFRAALSGLPFGSAGTLAWSTLVPIDNRAMSLAAPLFEGFEQRQTEVRRICKVVLPADAVRHGTIGMGNHVAAGADGRQIQALDLGLPLFHVPVRSKEQIVAKTLIGSYKMSIKVGRKPGEVFHWDLIAAFIRANRFRLSDEQLREIALNYGFSAGDPKVRDTSPFKLGLASDSLKYPELATVEVAHLVDGFLSQLCEEVRLTRSTASLLRKALVSWLRS